jgi:hypothetical protein
LDGDTVTTNRINSGNFKGKELIFSAIDIVEPSNRISQYEDRIYSLNGELKRDDKMNIPPLTLLSKLEILSNIFKRNMLAIIPPENSQKNLEMLNDNVIYFMCI